MSRNTVEHVIRKFGSQQRVAELLGIWQTAVSGWVRRGAIPARRQEELLAIARREGIELEPGRFLRRARGRTAPTASPCARSCPGRGRQRPADHHFLEPRRPTPQGSRTVMTANTAEVIELKQPHADPDRHQGPVRDRRDPAARPRAGQHVRLGDPQGPARRADHRHAAGGGADRHHRRRRVPGHGDGRGRQLQRRLGGAGHPAVAARRPQAALPHRGLGRVGHRLRGGLEGEAVEGRRRGRHPLQPGRRRRRGVQRRRPDELAEPADLGLRDHRTARSPSSARCSRAS